MKIRYLKNIEEAELNEVFDFSNEIDGIEDSVETLKVLSSFDDLCWNLLNSFYQFISVHYGDPEWFPGNPYGVEFFTLTNDKLPFIDGEVFLSNGVNSRKLYFTGKFSNIKGGFMDKSRTIIFELPMKGHNTQEFLSYNHMMEILNDALTSKDYDIVLKWIDESNRSSCYSWSVEAGRKNVSCVKEYVTFCNEFINTFDDAAKTPYKDIDKVRNLSDYKKKFTDLLYNFFTLLDIDGRCPKPIGGRIKRFKFDFTEYGIQYTVIQGSNIFFTKHDKVGADSLDTNIHVNALVNPRDYWSEALKALGKFEFSWTQICLEGGSVNIFYKIGEDLDNFIKNEIIKMKSLKESFDFNEDDKEDNIRSYVEGIKNSRAIVDFLTSMEDASVRISPEDAIRKLNSFVEACSNGLYHIELKYDKNDHVDHGYWIKVGKGSLAKLFYIIPGNRLVYLENIARCAMWIYACLFDEPSQKVDNKIQEYGKKYRFNPKLFDFEWSKDRVKEKYSSRCLNESFDFDSEEGSDIIDDQLQTHRKLREFNELYNHYMNLERITWMDVDDIVNSLKEICSNSVGNAKCSVRLEETPEKKNHHAMKKIIFKRISDGKEYVSKYSKYDVDFNKWMPLHRFVHLMCIIGSCLFSQISKWDSNLIKVGRQYGWNLDEDSVKVIYQSFFELA